MSHLGEFEQVILFSIVQLDSEACGVSIRDTIRERTGRAASSGSIYTTLGRMEERDLVTSTDSAPGSGGRGRPRKYYRVTPKGARALMAAYTMIRAMAGDVIPELTKLAES